MTHIVQFPTKKAFKEAVEKDPTQVYVSDPAVVGAVSGRVPTVLAILQSRGEGGFDVTNHPKRSWYANVSLGFKGEIVVE